MVGKVQDIWEFLQPRMTSANFSSALALLAFLVSLLSFYVSRRGVRAAQAQAAAAQDQAVAAEAQADEASRAASEAARSAEMSELTLVSQVRSQIATNIPNLILLLERPIGPYLCLETIPRMAVPHPPDIEPLKSDLELRFWDDRWKNIYYVLHGVIFNDSSRSAAVMPGGLDLYAGLSSLWPGRVEVPRLMHPNNQAFLLEPQQAALFEWKIENTLDAWVDLTEDKPNLPPLEPTFTTLYADWKGSPAGLRLQAEIDPVVRKHNQEELDNAVWVVRRNAYPSIAVDWQGLEPRDLDQVKRELLPEKYNFWLRGLGMP